MPSIPVLIEAATLLTEFSRPNHIVAYAHGDSFISRRVATPLTLGKTQFRHDSSNLAVASEAATL